MAADMFPDDLTEYNWISQELFGCDYNSASMTNFKQFEVRSLYERMKNERPQTN